MNTTQNNLEETAAQNKEIQARAAAAQRWARTMATLEDRGAELPTQWTQGLKEFEP